MPMGQYLSNVLYAKEVKQSKSKLTRSIILPCSKSLNRLLLLTTMRCLAIVLSALTLLGSQSTLTVGASSASRDFFYTFDMTDNSEALDMTVAETHCADACQVGDSIMIAGDLTIYEEFTETLCIKLMIAIQGSTSTATGSGDFCTFANVVSVDGSTECPAPGDYTFEIPMTVTGLSRGLQMHLDASIYDCDGSNNVDLDFDIYVYSVYSSFAWASIGLVSIVGAVMYRNRRRRIETVSAGDGEPMDGDFEMMKDQSVVV